MYPRTAHTGLVVLYTANTIWSNSAYHPGKMELANFRIPKSINILQKELGSRMVQDVKLHVHNVREHVNPKTNMQNVGNRRSRVSHAFSLPVPSKVFLLCSPPSSALVMGLFFLGSLIVDIRMVETRLGTGVSRSPESDAYASSNDVTFLSSRPCIPYSFDSGLQMKQTTLFAASSLLKHVECPWYQSVCSKSCISSIDRLRVGWLNGLFLHHFHWEGLRDGNR